MSSKTTKHILALVESLDVNDSSGTKGRVALLQNMVTAGCKVTALHYTQKEIALPGITTIQVKEGKTRFYFLSRLQKYFYKWFGYNLGTRYEKKTGFSFNWKGAENAFAKALKNHNPSDYDMLWTLGKGTNFRAHASALKRPEWHSKWYAYVHDPYPQQLYPRPFNFVPHGYKKKRYFLRDVSQHAHKMVFPSDLLKDWMQSYFPAIEGKELIIPHQISDVVVGSAKLPDYFDSALCNLLHAGNLLDLRDPSPLLKAFTAFTTKNPKAKIKLLFLGKTGKFESMLSKASKENEAIYASNGYVPFEQVYRMQQQASVNIILEAKAEISPFLPGKFAHCVVANKPILLVGPHYSESKRLLGKNYPYACEFEEIEAIEDAITLLYKAWEEGNELRLDRENLEHYMSPQYLKEILSKEC